jgi:uncharacterized protein
MMNEFKVNSGPIVEYKEIDNDGVKVGIVKGYLATWDIDEGRDQYIKGAFSDHLDKMIQRGKQKLQLTDYHGKVIGGIPLASMKEDDRGLYVESEINLDMETGRDVYSLVKQKVYDSFSTEYAAVEKSFEDGIRKITKSKIFGGALLSNPMNNNAVITEVKQYSITDLKNIGKSDLFNILRSASLSRDAANHLASLFMTDSRNHEDGNPLKMLSELRNHIKLIQENIKNG